MALDFHVIPVTPYQQNCTIVFCNETMKAAVIDPGGDRHLIDAVIAQRGLSLEKVWLTHGHLDHASATVEVAEHYQVPVEGPHQGDDYWIASIPQQCASAGFPPAASFTPQRWLNDGDTVTIGNLKFDVFHCPGHTPGHVVFYNEESRWAQVGDVIFSGSIGRSDLPGGDHNTLISSIRNKLFALGNDVRFVPGHGPMSTFGVEKQTNPFVADQLFS